MFNIPGGGILIVLSLSVLAILYFPLAFYFFSDKTIKAQNLPLSIISGFFLSLAPIGIMFKLQFWPSYSMLLIAAFMFSIVFAFIGYFYKKESADNLVIYYRQFFSRAITLTILTGFFYFTPMQTLIKIQEWRDPHFARLKIQAYENPDNERYQQELMDYWDKRDGVK
jgi:hypothetical protein